MYQENTIQRKGAGHIGWIALCLVLATLGLSAPVAARQSAAAKPSPSSPAQSSRDVTTQDYNRRIEQLLRSNGGLAGNSVGNYQIGPEDLLQISVLEAPDLSRTLRVSEDGEISLPLLGTVRAAGLTSRELQTVLETLLRRTYMKNPHVSVFVQEMRSHPVSVFGAVEKPGVFQIRGPKTLIEVLSMAQGLAADAGDSVIVMRHAGDPVSAAASMSPESGSTPTAAAHLKATSAKTDSPGPLDEVASGPGSIKISLKQLLDSGDSRYNVLVYPGDVVKVTRAGIVYVVGDVRKPGGFLLKTNENISVLQALALAEGLAPTAQGKQARIIISEPNGTRKEVAINLNKVLEGKAPDPVLHSRDILFVPNSTRKAAVHAFYRTAEGIAAAVSGAAVYRW